MQSFDYTFSFTAEEMITLQELLIKTEAGTDPQAAKAPIYKRILQEIDSKSISNFLNNQITNETEKS